MIILITGPSHVGKTALAQKLMEKYNYPYFSIDHLKMGLIRSGNTYLTPMSDDKDLTDYLWPIVREMVKTAIENRQNLIVEGCYIPLDWQKDFEFSYSKNIKFIALAMSENYINNNFDKIEDFADIIEKRICDDYSLEDALKDNAEFLERCKLSRITPQLIDTEYYVNIGDFDE